METKSRDNIAPGSLYMNCSSYNTIWSDFGSDNCVFDEKKINIFYIFGHFLVFFIENWTEFQ